MAASNSSKKFCFICQKQFKSDAALKQHEAFHNRRKGFKCNICDNVFISKKFLLKHKASHKVDKNTHKVQFQVKRCTSNKTKAIVLQRTPTPAAFEISTNVEAERRQDMSILKSVNIWNCGICRSSYPSNEVLNIHLGIGKKRRHLCEYCFKCFNCAQQYADHVITHDAKVVICHICGGSLKTQELFKKHIEQHAVVRTYNCDQCHFPFSRKYDLNRHKKTCNSNKSTTRNSQVSDKKSEDLAHVDEGDLIVVRKEEQLTAQKLVNPDGDESMSVLEDSQNAVEVMEYYDSDADPDYKPDKNDVKNDEDNDEDDDDNRNGLSLKQKSKESRKSLASDKIFSKQEVNRTQTCDICGKVYKDEYHFTRHLKEHSQHGQEKPTCSICNITFKLTSNLKRHMRKHSQTKDFKCKICGKEFYRPDDLAVHEKSHSKTKSHFCDICGDGFSSLNNLKRHKLIHAKKLHHNYKCTYCKEEKLFICKVQLWKHQEQVHSEHLLYHQCKECNVRFASGRRLDRHNKIYHPPVPPSPKPLAEEEEKEKKVVRLIKKRSRSSSIQKNTDILWLEHPASSSKWVSNDGQIVETRNSSEAATTEPERGDETGSTKSHDCTYCEKSFITLAEVKEHIQKEHSEKQSICYMCGKIFVNKHNLIGHLDKFHDDVKVKNCPFCEKKVETKLYEHMKKEHNDARDYKCEICQKTFFRKADLNLHVRQHTGERPHSCEVCGSSFYSISNLRRHTYLHYSTKEFICHICGKSYNCKNYLQTHIKRNHNADPNLRFKCDICCKEFTNDTNLKRHINIHMGIKAHICEVCGKSFRRTDDLKQHKRTHDRSTSYPCDKCGKIYAQQQSLKNHMESHDRKKMQCEKCERTFKQMKAYEKHTSSCVGKKIKMAADNENNENLHDSTATGKSSAAMKGGKRLRPSSRNIKGNKTDKSPLAGNVGETIKSPSARNINKTVESSTRNVNTGETNESPSVRNDSNTIIHLDQIQEDAPMADPQNEIVVYLPDVENYRVGDIYRCTVCNTDFVEVSQLIAHLVQHFARNEATYDI